jgi:hypothetical protein
MSDDRLMVKVGTAIFEQDAFRVDENFLCIYISDDCR